MADISIIPSRTALVNVDMQNCFVTNSPVTAPEDYRYWTELTCWLRRAVMPAF
jgi:nicotinamidase-related amidase